MYVDRTVIRCTIIIIIIPRSVLNVIYHRLHSTLSQRCERLIYRSSLPRLHLPDPAYPRIKRTYSSLVCLCENRLTSSCQPRQRHRISAKCCSAGVLLYEFRYNTYRRGIRRLCFHCKLIQPSGFIHFTCTHAESVFAANSHRRVRATKNPGGRSAIANRFLPISVSFKTKAFTPFNRAHVTTDIDTFDR